MRQYCAFRTLFIIGCAFALSPTTSLTAEESKTTMLNVTEYIRYEDRHTYEQPGSKPLNCLPKDVRADEIVSSGSNGTSKVTVKQKLSQMKARCHGVRLLDEKGREIRFFRVSCWGNPLPDYLEIRQHETEELKKLEKRFTVITFSCNPQVQ